MELTEEQLASLGRSTLAKKAFAAAADLHLLYGDPPKVEAARPDVPEETKRRVARLNRKAN